MVNSMLKMHSPSQRLIGAEQIVAQRGKLCVVSPSSGISVVDVATVPPRILPIWLPEEFEPVFIGIFQETIVQELVGELSIYSSDEHSWKKSRDLLEKVGRQGDLTGYRVSCLLIGAKDDLTPYPRAVQDSVKVK
ncbi:Mitochondrial Rho GTPase 2 [Glycine max]|nr:Mitochondrial Rho GTPase 2 [Glycine max]